MNRRHSGFTLIELMIVMVVIVVLTVLGTVAMGAIQKQAEDSERAEDVASIARSLEGYYKNGNPHVIGVNTKGTYPSLNEMIHMFGWNWCPNDTFTPCNSDDEQYAAEILPGITRSAMTPPGLPEQVEIATTWLSSNAQIATDLDAGKYVYKPLQTGTGDAGPNINTQCYNPGECRAFVILYKKSDGTLVTVRSKHQ